MYAIIETGGKQFKVTEGSTIKVEKLDIEPGEAYTFSNVLALVDGEKASFGAPYIEGAAVMATAVSQGRAKKVIIYKYKSKKGYHKKRGHRQPFTELTVDKIGASEKTAPKATKKPAAKAAEKPVENAVEKTEE